jgi:hypothetical protein
MEPAHADAPKPWWRKVEQSVHKVAPVEAPLTLSDSAPWPLD